jgi:hypothetical protein
MVLAAFALVAGGCATSSDVFQVHQATMAQRALEEATADRRVCPVVVANDTGQYLEVDYVAAGMRNELGVVPSGQRAEINVLCDAGSVDAFGVVTMEGMYSGRREFRSRVRLDRTKVSVLRFTDLHAVR